MSQKRVTISNTDIGGSGTAMANKALCKALLGVLSIFVSVALAFESSHIAYNFSLRTPGMWVSGFLFNRLGNTGGTGRPMDIGIGFGIEKGVDALCWLVVIWSLYLLIRKLLGRDEQ
jgi:hypothetical protein